MKKTILNNVHKKLNAKMINFAGFEMPVSYSSITEEHFAVRERAGIFDVSHMGQFVFKGDKAKDFLQYLTTNNLNKLELGKAQYTCLLNEKGGIIDDVIIYNMKFQHYVMVVNASNIEKDWNWITKNNASYGVEIENISENVALLAVQGPLAEKTLQKITDTDLSKIPYYHFKQGILAGIEVYFSNTGYTGANGFELYFDKKQAEFLWNKIIETGQDIKLLPCGLASRDTLRLEKCYSLYGNDLNEEVTPIEASLNWIVSFKKDFIAKDILLNQVNNGTEKKLTPFEMIDKGIPRKDYKIKNEHGEEIGYVTSGNQSPIKKTGIGLGYINSKSIQIGSIIFIQVRDKLLKAKITQSPFL